MSNRLRTRYLVKGLAVIGSLVAIGFLVRYGGLGDILDQGWIDRAVRGHGLRGELLYLAVAALATAVGLPRQAIAFMAGYAFGFLTGTLLGTLAALAGCALAFSYARIFGRALVTGRLAGKARRLEDFIRGETFAMTVLVRLLPVGSNLITNLAAGVARIPAMPFLLGSGIGYIPQNAVFALIGSGVEVDPAWRIGLGVVLFVVSGLLGVHLYRRMRHGRSFDESLDRELDA